MYTARSVFDEEQRYIRNEIGLVRAMIENNEFIIEEMHERLRVLEEKQCNCECCCDKE